MFDPRRPTLRYRIDRGDCLGVVWLALGSVALVEIAARQKPNAIVLDCQHGLWERRDLEAALGAAPPEVPVMVRVAENGPLAIGEALDAGAEGVIVPLVETAKEARKAVRAARFPPHGARSGGGVRPLHDFAAYVEGAERGIVVIPMIETAQAISNLDEILSLPGIDAIYVGPADLGVSLGLEPQGNEGNPVFDGALAAIVEACGRHGVVPGIHSSGALTPLRRRQGFRMITVTSDALATRVGYASELAAARQATPAAAGDGKLY